MESLLPRLNQIPFLSCGLPYGGKGTSLRIRVRLEAWRVAWNRLVVRLPHDMNVEEQQSFWSALSTTPRSKTVAWRFDKADVTASALNRTKPIRSEHPRRTAP